MTDDDEWKQRLAEQVGETTRRRQQRRDARDQLAAARAHGLRRRHETKEAHTMPSNWRIVRKWWHVYGGPISHKGKVHGWTQSSAGPVLEGPHELRPDDGRPVTAPLAAVHEIEHGEGGEPVASDVQLRYLASLTFEPTMELLNAIATCAGAIDGAEVSGGPDHTSHDEPEGAA